MWNSFIEGLASVNSFINNIVWGWPVIILILGTGLLLTIRTKVLQIRKFGDSFSATIIPAVKSFKKKKNGTKDKNAVSPFEAFATAISGTVGTGNIIGVTAAILTGGPGAIFWMWVSAFFGMVTNYAENVLGLYYRKKDAEGNFSGGAFYYLAYGVKMKWLGYVAAVFTVIAAVGMSGAQTNKISSTLALAFGSESTTAKLIVGIVLALLVGVIIIGGIKRISKVASQLVPFMSLLFIVVALIAIVMNIKEVPSAFAMIFENAFGMKAAAGGIAGYAFSVVIKKGMARGVFSNEAGLGSSVIAHSASSTREPVKQGLWGIFEVFFDTFVICTLSALMLLTTFGENILTISREQDTATAMQMFSENFGTFGVVVFAIILPLFAFTTIMAWSYYGEKATEFCFQKLGTRGKKISVLVFKILYVVLIVAASVITSTLAWDISDTANGLMAIPNLVAVICLSGKVAAITKNYYQRKKGEKVEPMLSADPVLNEEFKADLAQEEKEEENAAKI